MKRLLLFLLLIPALSFGQQVYTFEGKVLTAGGKVATEVYCDNYQTVYDAFTTTPAKNYSGYWNTMVETIGTYWDSLDVFYFFSAHTNTAGEALLDWKQPTGGPSLLNPGKGNFDLDEEGMQTFGTNTLTYDSLDKSVKSTFVDDNKGMRMFLNNDTELTTNLTIGKSYLVSVYAKSIVGVCGVKIYDGNAYSSGQILSTSWKWYYFVMYCNHATYCFISGYGLGEGEEFKIGAYDIKEWTNATAYNAPTFTAYEGFTGNGTTQYIDCNWNPAANGVNYTQNSASQIIYIRTNIAAAKWHGTGVNLDSKDILLNPRDNGGQAIIRTNDATSINNAGSNDGDGMFINNRTAAAVKKLYRNKVAIINGTTASTGVPTKNPYCLAYNDDDVAAGFRADQVACYAFGAGLSQTAVNTITDAVETCMDAMGSGIIP